MWQRRTPNDRQRRYEYLQKFNRLSAEDQRPHFSLILRKIAGRLAGAKVNQPRRGLAAH